MRGIFWTLLFLIGLVALLVSSGPLKWPIVAVRLALEEAPKALPLPIAGVAPAALRDTWGAARGSGRRHEGIDIFAPKGTPIRSTTRGLVFRVGQNRLGGNVVWIFGPGRQMHYYAHLDRFGEFEPGDLVMPGDIVGYVGDTGNARGTPPHLHYGVYTGAGAINPFPLLQQDQSAASCALRRRVRDASRENTCLRRFGGEMLPIMRRVRVTFS
jgi:murein DD-endopeptidase MepM/ murein hydrolase activator NlpD